MPNRSRSSYAAKIIAMAEGAGRDKDGEIRKNPARPLPASPNRRAKAMQGIARENQGKGVHRHTVQADADTSRMHENAQSCVIKSVAS